MFKTFLNNPINFHCHAIQVLHHVFVLKAQYPLPHLLEVFCALRIACHLLFDPVIVTVQLDHELRLCAIEIGDVIAERCLSSKANRVVFQEMIPEFPLRKRHVLSQRSRIFDMIGIVISHLRSHPFRHLSVTPSPSGEGQVFAFDLPLSVKVPMERAGSARSTSVTKWRYAREARDLPSKRSVAACRD